MDILTHQHTNTPTHSHTHTNTKTHSRKRCCWNNLIEKHGHGQNHWPPISSRMGEDNNRQVRSLSLSLSLFLTLSPKGAKPNGAKPTLDAPIWVRWGKSRVFMTWEYCFNTFFHKIDSGSTNYCKQKVNTLRNEVIRKLQTWTSDHFA